MPQTIAEAAAAASSTVAHGDDRACRLKAGLRRDVSVIKAGGIDLLDLHERRTAAAGDGGEFARRAGARRVTEDEMAACASVRWPRWASLADSSAPVRSAIGPSPVRYASRRARKSATWRHSAATCCSGRTAGICAPTPITACARAAATASPSAAKTSITRFSTTCPAPSCTLRRRPLLVASVQASR